MLANKMQMNLYEEHKLKTIWCISLSQMICLTRQGEIGTIIHNLNKVTIHQN